MSERLLSKRKRESEGGGEIGKRGRGEGGDGERQEWRER
jgi:hypothetical protein